MRKRRWLVGLTLGAVLGILWRREQETGEVSRWLKYTIIRGAQTARLVRGRERAAWVRCFYVFMAPAYDLAFLSMPGYRLAAQDLIDRLVVEPEDVVLDVGCGTGLLTLPLAERTKRVAGLDLSPDMLVRLAAKAARHGLTIDLQRGSVLDLPFAHGTFDLVTTSFMLLYLTSEEKMQALKEIWRVLAPGGRLGCLSSLGEIADIFLTHEEWADLLRQAGFTDVQIEERYDVFRLVIAYKADRSNGQEL